jgi:hypothetical protein
MVAMPVSDIYRSQVLTARRNPIRERVGLLFIAAALRRPARAPCTRRTSPASSGLDPSAPRVARARPLRAAAPATGRPPTRFFCFVIMKVAIETLQY